MKPSNLIIFYPATGETNFETSRLATFIEYGLRYNVEVIPMPIDPVSALDIQQEDQIYDKISHYGSLNLLWLRSVTLIINQKRLIRRLSQKGMKLYNYLSLGDEYDMTQSDIIVNINFYDGVIIYNNRKYQELDILVKDDFMYLPILSNTNLESLHLSEIKNYDFCFIGYPYRSRVKDLKILVSRYHTHSFFVAGHGWTKKLSALNLSTAEFLESQDYVLKLSMAKFSFILNRDDENKFHVTSKLIDTVSAGTVPIWDDEDPEFRDYQSRFSGELLTFNSNGDILPYQEYLRLRSDRDYYHKYIRDLEDFVMISSDAHKHFTSFFKKVLSTEDREPKYHQLDDLIVSQNSQKRLSIFCFHLKRNSKNLTSFIDIPISFLGLKVPLYILCYRIVCSGKILGSGGRLLVSGEELIESRVLNNLTTFIRRYLRKKIYKWP